MRKITYLGDSITFGQYVDPSLRWTSLIDKRLPSGWTSRNEGVNGETTRLALERFPQAVQADPPDILTIQYGLNDCNCWQTDKGLPRVSIGAFRGNLDEMRQRALTFGVKRIVFITNHPTHKPREYETSNALYSGAVWSDARKSLVDVCDMYLVKAWKDGGLLLPDGLHLSPAGHQLYADTIWTVLERCIKEIES